MALSLLVDSVEQIGKLEHESLIIQQTNDGLNSTCNFVLLDIGVIQSNTWTVQETRVEDGDVITDYITFDPDTKVEVSIVDGPTVYFAGILSRITARHTGGRNRRYTCECHDFNALIEESVIDELEEYTTETDGTIIDDLFLNYVTGIDYATHVTPSGYSFDQLSFENVTVRQALDVIAAQSGCVWYVDYSKKLHYATAESNAPAWHLSDDPDDVNSFSYDNKMRRGQDATNLVNQVLVVGSEIATWYTDAASVAEYGAHKAVVRDTSLVEADDMEARGDAILDKFKDPIITYITTITKDGLRAGMHIRLVSALYDLDDTFLISLLTITFPVDGEPRYRLTCGGITSSQSASAHRLTLDRINNPTSPILSAQLPLASRGWGHDLVFSSTDDDTVAWAAGTITTAAGDTFSIAAGNTDDPGAMAAKTIIYLDTGISLTALQMTTDETAALGIHRIMVAVAWPGTADAEAGFQVFGASAEVQTYLNADNIVANCVTANEIYGNTLSVIAADMGVLTAGTIQTAGAGNNRVVINIADGIRGLSAADVVQFQLDPDDGKCYCGAGAVKLDADGITLLYGSGSTKQLKWATGAGALMGYLYTGWGGGAGDDIITYVIANADNVSGDEAEVDLVATKGSDDIRFRVNSDGTFTAALCSTFNVQLNDAAGTAEFRIKDSGAVVKFRVDSDGNTDVEGDLHVEGDIHTEGEVQFTETNYNIKRVGSELSITVAGTERVTIGGTFDIIGNDLKFAGGTQKLYRSGVNLYWFDGSSAIKLN